MPGSGFAPPLHNSAPAEPVTHETSSGIPARKHRSRNRPGSGFIQSGRFHFTMNTRARRKVMVNAMAISPMTTPKNAHHNRSRPVKEVALAKSKQRRSTEKKCQRYMRPRMKSARQQRLVGQVILVSHFQRKDKAGHRRAKHRSPCRLRAADKRDPACHAVEAETSQSRPRPRAYSAPSVDARPFKSSAATESNRRNGGEILEKKTRVSMSPWCSW